MFREYRGGQDRPCPLMELTMQWEVGRPEAEAVSVPCGSKAQGAPRAQREACDLNLEGQGVLPGRSDIEPES